MVSRETSFTVLFFRLISLFRLPFYTEQPVVRASTELCRMSLSNHFEGSEESHLCRCGELAPRVRSDEAISFWAFDIRISILSVLRISTTMKDKFRILTSVFCLGVGFAGAQSHSRIRAILSTTKDLAIAFVHPLFLNRKSCIKHQASNSQRIVFWKEM